jgi:hypothetical protein
MRFARIARVMLLPLAFAIAACALFIPRAISATTEQIVHDCRIEYERARDFCVRDSCGGACTLEAWNRCVRIGENRWKNCVIAMSESPNATPPRKPRLRPLPANNPDLATPRPKSTPKPPAANILDGSPAGSPKGPSGAGAPVSASPPKPVFQ